MNRLKSQEKKFNEINTMTDEDLLRKNQSSYAEVVKHLPTKEDRVNLNFLLETERELALRELS